LLSKDDILAFIKFNISSGVYYNMSTKEVWFSHRQNIHQVKRKWYLFGKKFSLAEEKEIWDWDNCTAGIARSLDNRLIVVIRSKTSKNSSFMGN